MKIRKDKGTSKLAKDPKKSTIENVIDEIVDIHKVAYEDVKSFVTPIFDDIKDFEGLKAKIAAMADDLETKLETAFADIKEEGEAKRELALDMLEKTKQQANSTMEKAKAKAMEFGDIAEDAIDTWVADVQKKLESTYKKLKTKVEKMDA